MRSTSISWSHCACTCRDGQAAPAHVVVYIASAGKAALASVVEYISPALAGYATPAPVGEHISPAPVGYAAPARSTSALRLRLQRTQCTPHQHLSLKASLQLLQCLTLLMRPWMGTLSLRLQGTHAPASVVGYISPAPVGYAVAAPVVEYIPSAPVGYATLALVDEYVAPAPVGYAAPASVVENIASAGKAALASVVEYISPALAGYATPALHRGAHCACAKGVRSISTPPWSRLRLAGLKHVAEVPGSGRRLRREVHSAGSSTNRDGRRGAVHSCHTFKPSSQTSLVECGHLGHLFFVVSKSFPSDSQKLHKFRLHSAACYLVGPQSSAMEGRAKLDRRVAGGPLHESSV